jgi:uncharacterized protein (TIGR02001 family)
MSLDRSPGSHPQPLARTLGLAIAECAAIAAAAASSVQDALAQTSISASIASEYSARGRSLSQGRPAAQLRVDYDSSQGWYAGAMASRVEFPYIDAGVQLITYGGYGSRLSSGLAWEAGALNVSFRPDRKYQYHEFYGGLTRDRVEGRLYFSPSYYGGGKTVYAELNASWPLRDRFTLIGHLGLLHPFGDSDGDARNRLDLRLGLGMKVGNYNFQLAVLGSAPHRRGPNAARALALSATYAF